MSRVVNYSTTSDDEMSQLEINPLGDTDETIWSSIWRCVGCVPNAEGVDKQLQHCLSRAKVVMSQHGTDLGIVNIQGNMPIIESLLFQGRLKAVVKDVVKDLVNIGSQLSQTRKL
jgi:hypothetical protein